ncbi:hypothetical protein NM688_g2220 [Phlebia brevispora]|uniref:Uncharacterized protein n=1 Tax=Phlebia brevispora TaxID=194682 RepID=A0ACC1T9X1_9APHY|nr:hypothetical protein NM688_g2220 [Phlebia brevispora]
MVVVTVQYADTNIYSTKPDLQTRYLAAVRMSWVYYWARYNNINTLLIMGGIHRSCSDGRNHLTIRANTTKGVAKHLAIEA